MRVSLTHLGEQKSGATTYSVVWCRWFDSHRTVHCLSSSMSMIASHCESDFKSKITENKWKTAAGQ